MKKGLITDIQRFSLNDGPGIRTTVFFKGCNMKCSWCHNPETISHTKEIMFYPSKCIDCGICFETCQFKAHRLENGAHIIDRNICTLCGKCVNGCYADALVFSAREASAEEIMNEIRQDKIYYSESGGGVTLSGGEVTCQCEVALEIVRLCKDEGIKTAVETNMLIPFERSRKLLEAVDIVMLDIKLMNDSEHRKHTGVSNKSILENIKKLDGLGTPFIVRTPLIPEITDSKDNIRAIAEFIAPLKNLMYYELLNFNPLGASKYQSLNTDNALDGAKPLSKEAITQLVSEISDLNIKIKTEG